MYNHFNSGNGNFELTNADFDNIKNYVSCSIKTHTYRNFHIFFNDGSQGKAYIVPFYKSEQYDHAFGTATIYINENNEIIGFLDYYDFDSRSWGERSWTSEIISRSIKLFSPQKAKPFKITYGLQAVTPIYDVLQDKSFSKIS